MSLDPTTDVRGVSGDAGRLFGVYTAIVTDNVDPSGLGRVKVRLPWSPDRDRGDYETWARLATLMAGPNRGSWFIPDIDDEVLLAFEGGDPRHPYVLGALWNGRDRPPERIDRHGRNAIKTLRSRSGIAITLDDSARRESLTLETPGGQRLVLEDGGNAVTVEDGNGNRIRFDAGGVTVQSPSTVTIRAAAVKVAAGQVTVDAEVARFSGVVRAETVIANTMVKRP